MSSVVLAPFTGAYDLLCIGYCSGSVEALRNAFPTKVLGMAW